MSSLRTIRTAVSIWTTPLTLELAISNAGPRNWSSGSIATPRSAHRARASRCSSEARSRADAANGRTMTARSRSMTTDGSLRSPAPASKTHSQRSLRGSSNSSNSTACYSARTMITRLSARRLPYHQQRRCRTTRSSRSRRPSGVAVPSSPVSGRGTGMPTSTPPAKRTHLSSSPWRSTRRTPSNLTGYSEPRG